MKRAMVLAFVVAAAFGLYLTMTAGWPIAVLGLVSIAAGIAYTGGPYPLGYHGLGDVAVMAFFGFVAVCGTTYVQTAAVPCLAWWAGAPVGALATAILVVNNVRDRAGDARVGKRTLAVRFGRTGAILEYAALLVVAYAVPVGLAVCGSAPWRALPLLTLPLAVGRMRALLAAATGPEHNACLSATAKLLALHGVLFATGLVL
jgi:1,4-dihydroxy-2-naphthoate octaprenyltransferase